MAHGRIINRSEAMPCPICGKPDWCGAIPIEDGMFLELCMREHSGCDIVGKGDGRQYVFLRETKIGNAVYEEASQHEVRRGSHSQKKNFRKGNYVQPTLKKVDEVVVRDNEYLDKIYRYFLSLLVLDDMHKRYLLSEHWTEGMIEKHMIRSFPENDFIRFKYGNNYSKNLTRKKIAKKIVEHFQGQYGIDCLKGVPGAYKDSKGEWTFAGAKGILFPCYDVNGNLYRLRIRMDFMDVKAKLVYRQGTDPYYDDEKGIRHFLAPMKGVYTLSFDEKSKGEKVFEKGKGKYRNFSSFHADAEAQKQGFLKNSYDSGCEAGNQLGIYYSNKPGEENNMFVCFITEGEKKGIFCNEHYKAPFISVPGVNSWSKLIEGEKGKRAIDILRAQRVGIFVIAYDSDKAVNDAVMKNQMHVIKALQAEGFAVCTAEWDMLLGKGIDDLLAAGHHPNYSIV